MVSTNKYCFCLFIFSITLPAFCADDLQELLDLRQKMSKLKAQCQATFDEVSQIEDILSGMTERYLADEYNDRIRSKKTPSQILDLSLATLHQILPTHQFDTLLTSNETGLFGDILLVQPMMADSFFRFPSYVGNMLKANDIASLRELVNVYKVGRLWYQNITPADVWEIERYLLKLGFKSDTPQNPQAKMKKINSLMDEVQVLFFGNISYSPAETISPFGSAIAEILNTSLEDLNASHPELKADKLATKDGGHTLGSVLLFSQVSQGNGDQEDLRNIIQFSARLRRALSRANIRTIEELISRDSNSLLSIRTLGQTSLAEIKEFLAKLGLKLLDPAPGN